MIRGSRGAILQTRGLMRIGRAATVAWVAMATAGPLFGQSAEDAYLDAVARRLVEGAKARRDDSGPASYTARLHERQVFEMVTERRAHLLRDYRYAARVRWSREGAAVRLEGHWSRYPRWGPPDSLFARRAVDRPPEPGRNPFRFGLRQLATLGVLDSADMASIVAPLDPGAERFYRYRSGDTLSVTLPGGEVVRTVVVEAMPRYRSIRFMASLIWIEPETHGVARVAFRPAKPIDREATFRLRDADGWNAGVDFDFSEGGAGGEWVDGERGRGDSSAVPSAGRAEVGGEPGGLGRLVNWAFNSALPRFELAASSIVVEYSLWGNRWWLPHSMTARMHQTLIEEPGSWDWEEYPEIMVRASVQAAFEIEEASETRGGTSPALGTWEQPGDSVVPGAGEGLVVLVPRRRLREASSPADLFLPASWDADAHEPGGDRMAAELARIEVDEDEGADDEGADAPPESTNQPSPWFFEPPLLTLRLLDYNRSEGLVVGSRLWRSFPWGRVALATNAGTRRARPRVFLSLDSRFPAWRLRVSAYHDYRPASVLPGDATVSPDDPSWYAADGVRVWLSPARRNRQSVAVSLFAERHDEYGAGEMRSGATAAWRPWWGSRSGRLRGGAALSLAGTLEDDPRLRAAATATAILFPGRRVSIGTEAGAARTWGGPPRTDSWLLDPSGRWFRGRTPQGLVSRVALRARADVQLRVRFARLSIFSDWMRTFADWPPTDAPGLQRERLTFLSAGAGVVLPGGLRIDLARRFSVNGDAPPDSKWRPWLSFGTAF